MTHEELEKHYERTSPESPRVLGEVLKKFFEDFEACTTGNYKPIYTRWEFRRDIMAHRYEPETGIIRGYACTIDGYPAAAAENTDIYIRHIADTTVLYSIGNGMTPLHHLVELKKSPFQGETYKSLFEAVWSNKTFKRIPDAEEVYYD